MADRTILLSTIIEYAVIDCERGILFPKTTMPAIRNNRRRFLNTNERGEDDVWNDVEFLSNNNE